MRNIYLLFIFALIAISCNQTPKNQSETTSKQPELSPLAKEVVQETQRSWNAYKQFAWGHDALKPLTKSHEDWYAEPLYISPIDAYSTLYLMGLDKEVKEIENYVIDSLNFDKDIDAKIFEVNIRILGGLLSMYELSKNEKILDKARDFADRMMPAFQTQTGIPRYWVNLKTGISRGDTVNIAEAGTYLIEMGVLSYYTQNPVYYHAAKKATLAVYNRRSEIGLIGDIIDVNSGQWVSESSHICAGVDSYYEYLYKAYILFGDKDLQEPWNVSIEKIQTYLADTVDNKLWYGRANMRTGKHNSAVITLYDAFFPAILVLSGDTVRARELQNSWNWLWNKYGLEPMAYDYISGKPTFPRYDLNPEIIESAYYLYHFTGDSIYLKMNEQYWSDVKKYCGTEIAFSSVANVETMEKHDYMPTFFFAETLKYFYLTFSHGQIPFSLDDYVFNTEAHPFKKSSFKTEELNKRLGINQPK